MMDIERLREDIAIKEETLDEHRLLNLIVYGEPVAKGRPRFTRQGHAYTPEKTTAGEKAIRDRWLSKYGSRGPLTGPLEVFVTAYRHMPTRFKADDIERAEKGFIAPVTRPDADNYLKLVLDALNGIAYTDDALIIGCTCEKRYSEIPRTEIRIIQVSG